MPVVAALTFAGCGITPEATYHAQGRDFASADAALADARTAFQDSRARVEALPAPMAGMAVFVVPTRERIDAKLREAWEKYKAGFADEVNYKGIWYDDYVALVDSAYPYVMARHELFWEWLPALVERRRIFASVRVVRADSWDAARVPDDAYVIFGEATPAPDRDAYPYRIDEDGYLDTFVWTVPAFDSAIITLRADSGRAVDPLRSHLVITLAGDGAADRVAHEALSRIEDFVRAYPPEGTAE